jgi:hypothetical protein
MEDNNWPTGAELQWAQIEDDDNDWPTADELWRARHPRTKDRKAQGQTAWLCGVSDGRGKVCGRLLDPDTFGITDENGVVMECPKHHQVFCEGAQFVAASKGRRSVLYFRSSPHP